MSNQKTKNDYRIDFDSLPGNTNNSNNIVCDCGSACDPSAKKSITEKIRSFFFYIVIIAALTIAIISILN